MQGLFGASLSWERFCRTGVDGTKKAIDRDSRPHEALTQILTEHDSLVPARQSPPRSVNGQ
jgi:hypothetical protein